MFIISFFTENGIPKTGLSPIIDVWKVSDNSQVVTAQAMSEIGGGFYKYNFAGYEKTQEYAVRSYGGASLPIAERYSYGGNEGYHDDIADIQDTIDTIQLLVRRILGLTQENFRLFNTSYDPTGTKLIGCTIKIYSNKTDCDADQNPIAEYTMESVYGMDAQLSSYKVTKNA
jgi:hypothetical protein